MALPELRTHRKFLNLARLLKGGEAAAMGHLEFIYLSCNDATDDTFDDATQLELCARWTGTKGTLAKHLVKVGLLDKEKNGRYRVHHYWDHCPTYIKKRIEARPKIEADRRRRGIPLESDGRPTDPDPDSPPLTDRSNPRSGHPQKAKIENRRLSSSDGGGAPPNPPLNNLGGAVTTLLRDLEGYNPTMPGWALPAPTKPIGAYDARDCIVACMHHDSLKPPDQGYKMWAHRVDKLAQCPGGLDYLRDQLCNIENSRIPGNPKAVGHVKKPAALLNAKTLEFLRQHNQEIN